MTWIVTGLTNVGLGEANIILDELCRSRPALAQRHDAMWVDGRIDVEVHEGIGV
ncbi:MAG: hypothetical protein AAFX99_24320 [Myxococcota bacterium]